jgi:hypothetical protein
LGKPLMTRAIGLASTDHSTTPPAAKAEKLLEIAMAAFLWPLKQLQPEYTPATSKGNPPTGDFWRRDVD